MAKRNRGRLTGPIKAILDMGKVSAGTLTVVAVPAPVSGLVDRTVDGNRGYANRHGVTRRLENRLEAGINAAATDLGRFQGN